MQALWDRVYAEPDDDDARRVLADALIERGDPRGELIAIQLQLARVPEDERGPNEQRLAEQERALLDAHGDEWTAGWPFEFRPWFIRGFPARQHARIQQVLDYGARAVAIAPTLRELVLTDEDPRRWSISRLIEPSWVRRLRHLTLPVTFRPTDALVVSQLKLRSLTFAGGSLGDAAVASLARMPLEHLAFEFDVGVRDLGELAELPLKTFITRGNPVRQPPASAELERLTVDRVELTVVPTRWPKLKRLELFETKLGRKRLRDLLDGGHPNVRRLGIRGERLDPAELELRLRWPALEVLETDAGLRRIR